MTVSSRDLWQLCRQLLKLRAEFSSAEFSWAEMAESGDEMPDDESLWEEGLRAIELEAHLGPELMTAAEFGNQAQVRAVPLCIRFVLRLGL